MSALDVVKAQIRAKHGKGAIMDTKKKWHASSLQSPTKVLRDG
jgi:hypothetical protein